MNHQRNFSFQKEKAQGMVEFALILPLLLIIIFGVIEMGRLLFIYSAVQTASREAARYGSAAGDMGVVGGNPQYMDCTGIRTAATRVGSLAGIRSTDIAIKYDHGPTTGNPNPAEFNTCEAILSPNEIKQGDRIVIEADAEYRPIVPVPYIDSFTINAKSSRTIIKDIAIQGKADGGTGLFVCFTSAESEILEAGGNIPIRFKLMGGSSGSDPVTATFQVVGGTADASDYSINPFTVTFAPDSPEGSIRNGTMSVVSDTVFEGNETVELWLHDSDHAERCDSPLHHVVTIIDDDPPLITFKEWNSSVSEPDGALQIHFELRHPVTNEVINAPRDINVLFGIDAGSIGQEGIDFELSSHSFTIRRGSSEGFISLEPVNDELYEDDEAVKLNISSPTADPGSITSHEIVIVNDDPLPEVEFVRTESFAPEKNATVAVEVRLVHPVTRAVTDSGVNTKIFFTPSGTAANNFDYITSPSPIFIPAGSTNGNINVMIREDSEVEDDETVVFDLVSADRAVIGAQKQHTLNITSTLVRFSQPEQLVLEQAGGTNITLQAELNKVGQQEIKVPFIVTGTAAAGEDYTLNTPASGVLEFPIGQTTASITLFIKDDLLDEEEETIIFTLKDAQNAAIVDPAVQNVKIKDNDESPVVSFTSSGQVAPESAGTIQITVQLSTVSGRQVSIPITTGGTAILGSNADYNLIPNTRTIVIPAGETAATLQIGILDDDLAELDETVLLHLGTPSGAILGAEKTFTLTISNNDEIPQVWFVASQQTGLESVGKMLIGLQLSKPSALPVIVPFTISSNSTMKVNADYRMTGSPVTIPAGETNYSFEINIQDDNIPEASERLILSMGEPENAVRRSIPEEHVTWVQDDDQMQCLDMYPTGPLDFTDKQGQLKYTTYFTNMGVEDVFITQINLGWAIKNGGPAYDEIQLVKIATQNTVIWQPSQPATTPISIIEDWILTADSALDPNTNYLTFYFQNTAGNNIKLSQLTHLTVKLSNDCPISWNVSQR